ncbi:MAG: DUF58 domain-containing protein [Phycisphaerae bacterium]|nr:DUF58 domain-containing protein [Phycisphaerae bacterium]
MTHQVLQPNLRYLDPETLQKIGSLELIAREVVEGLRVGAHRSPLRGFSTDFAHHRQYVPGDPLRHLDWRVYARTERYYTKLYEAETCYEAHLLLDASASMTYGSGAVSKLEYAKYLAASLAYLILKQRDSVGLGVFDSTLRSYDPPRSAMGILGLLDARLAEATGQPRTDIAAQLHELAHRVNRRGVVVLFSDLLEDEEGFLRGLDHLRFRGHNVIVFHLLDPYELTFPFSGTWRFEGLEGEDEFTTQPDRIRDIYMEDLQAFLNTVRTGCERSHVDYDLVDTSRPVDVVLSEFLARRSATSQRTG